MQVQGFKSFSNQNSLLRIRSKLTELTQNWTELSLRVRKVSHNEMCESK